MRTQRLAALIGMGATWLLMALILGVGIAPAPAHANNGQCRWEGGPGFVQGVNTYTYCQQEDCIGNGGFAQCTEPEFRPLANYDESETDNGKFFYDSCPPNTGDYDDFCRAAGGTYDFYANPECAGLSGGFVKNDPQKTSSEGLAIATAWGFMGERFPSCSVTSMSDTGWTTVPSSGCTGGAPKYRNGEVTEAAKILTFQKGGSCSGTTKVYIKKFRQLKCPHDFHSRTLPGGNLHCFIPAAVCPIGNPICGPAGSKDHVEVDYQPNLPSGLRLARHYNSQPYFRLPGSGIDANSPTARWSTNYDRSIVSAASLPGLMAVQIMEDGTIRHFDTLGVEALNRNGAADRLENLGASGWRLTTADRTVELYDPSGRLTSITQSSGVSLALTYDASGRLSTVTDPFGNQVICTYSPESRLMSVQLPGSMSVTYTYDTLGRLTHATYPDTTSRQYHYENVDYNYALTGVTDEAANRYSVFVHDAYGRISETSLAGTVNRFRYTYSNMGSSTSQTSVTVIDPLGTSRIHRFSNVRGVHKQQTNTG